MAQSKALHFPSEKTLPHLLLMTEEAEATEIESETPRGWLMRFTQPLSPGAGI